MSVTMQTTKNFAIPCVKMGREKYDMPKMLRLNLQFFADGEDDNLDTQNLDDDLDNNDDNDLSGDDMLLEALKSIQNDDNDDNDDDNNNDDNVDEKLDDFDSDDYNNDDFEDDDNADDDNNDDVDTGKKKVQSKEDNARFAAERRQRELDAKVQAELERLKQESPEFLLAKQLSEQYGATPEELVTQMREAQLQQESKDKNIPVEMLRERQAERDRLSSLEQELNQMRFESWQTKIMAESETLKTQFKMLNDNDIDEAVNYILYDAQNVNMSLQEAVYAKHGQKIIDGLVNDKIQSNLAKESGRKSKTPPSPNNGKTSTKPTATQDEQYIADKLGMKVDDYLKYK